eukprot:g48401.t1
MLHVAYNCVQEPVWNPSTMCDGYTAQARAAWLMRERGMSQDAAQKQVMAEFPGLFGCSGDVLARLHSDCVQMINQYRSSVGSAPVSQRTSSDSCMDTTSRTRRPRHLYQPRWLRPLASLALWRPCNELVLRTTWKCL